MKPSTLLFACIAICSIRSAQAMPVTAEINSRANLLLQRAALDAQQSNYLAYQNYVAGCMMAKVNEGLDVGPAYLFCDNLFKTTFKISL